MQNRAQKREPGVKFEGVLLVAGSVEGVSGFGVSSLSFPRIHETTQDER